MTHPEAVAPTLACLDLMIRDRILRLRARHELSADEFHGLYVSDAQVDALLAARCSPREQGAIRREVARLWPAALARLAVDPAWGAMIVRLGLTEFEILAVAMALAPHVDPRYLPLYAYLNDDAARRFLTPQLALDLADLPPDHPARWSVTPGGALFLAGVIEAAAPETEPALGPAGCALRLSPAVTAHLLGAPFDARFGDDAVTLVAWTAGQEPAAPAATSEAIARLRSLPPPRLFGVVGPPASAARAVALDLLATEGDAPVVEIRLAALAAAPDGSRRLREALLAARLAGAPILVRDLPEASDFGASEIAALLRGPAAVLAASRAALRRCLPSAPELDLPEPTVADRRRAWRRCLGAQGLAIDDAALWETADFFALPYAAIEAAAADLGATPGPLTTERLRAAARAASAIGFGAAAQRVSDGYDLDDLVLPAPVRARIEAFVAAVRNRRTVYETWDMARRHGPARGVAALFTGASGTGKSMAASVVARALGLDLYRIELAAVVSKYIGETEKNLDAVFAAAREANCVLFFDEADALFGKRSEVKDAHDRYANIECAYLLQKMERHDGVVILTTNMPRSLDAAFSRRLQFVIEFPRPDATLRERLWIRAFPPAVPLRADVDFPFLARNFDTCGGEIRTIALDCALQAAADGQGVGMRDLLKAIERQLVKQGRAPDASALRRTLQLVEPAT